MGLSGKNFVLGAFATVIFLTSTLRADDQYASKERSNVAKSHMSRARALLVEALEEFEEGRKYARPDLLIDSEDWRLRVVSLTEQLNRVVDPRPRVTREGAVFRVPPRFMKRERQNLPVVADGARGRSDIGERARLASKQQERAKVFNNNNLETAKADNLKSEIEVLKTIPSSSSAGSMEKESISKGRDIPKELAVPEEIQIDATIDEPSAVAKSPIKTPVSGALESKRIPEIKNDEELNEVPSGDPVNLPSNELIDEPKREVSKTKKPDAFSDDLLPVMPSESEKQEPGQVEDIQLPTKKPQALEKKGASKVEKGAAMEDMLGEEVPVDEEALKADLMKDDELTKQLEDNIGGN